MSPDRHSPGTATFLLAELADAPGNSHHAAIVVEAVGAHASEASPGSGVMVFAFARAADALLAAMRAHGALQGVPTPVDGGGVRMAIHTGDADVVDGSFAGSAVARASRLCALA